MLRRVPHPLALALALSLALAACGDDGAASTTSATATTAVTAATDTTAATATDGGESTGATTGDPAAVTWHQDIRPIVAGSCWACHNDQAGVAFALTDYAVAKNWASAMLAKIDGTEAPSFFMPPWGARETATCAPVRPWRGDPRLSAAERDLFAAWVDLGAPEGDPAAPAPLPPWEPEVLQGDLVTTHPIAGYALSAGDKSDHYACFSLDPGLAQPRWITGLQVLPDNDAIVHHVVLFGDPTGASAALAEGTGSYPCFGGSGVPDSDVLYAWAPGGNPLELPDNSGMPVAPGQRIVMQVHYHPTGKDEVDKTALALRWTDVQPQRTALMAVLGGVSPSQANASEWDDPPFLVPAGAQGHVETWREVIDLPLGVDVRIWSIFPHMHLAGTNIEVQLGHQGQDACLAAIPRWDFNWQRTYVYDAAYADMPRVYGGDTLTIRCTYDNSTQNPLLARALEQEGKAPSDLNVGEDTFDEMCTAIIGILY